MSTNKPLSVLLLWVGLALASCGARSEVLRVSAIPDKNKTAVADTAAALCAYLEEQVGVPVSFEPSNDYTAAVNGLLANKLDLVWLGGVTVKVTPASRKEVVPMLPPSEVWVSC